MTTVTRTLISASHPDLMLIAKIIGGMRADIWHRYGALASTRGKLIDFKSDCARRYAELAVDGTLRNETTIDTLNDIKAFREAAKRLVRKDIAKRAGSRQGRGQTALYLVEGQSVDQGSILASTNAQALPSWSGS